MLRLERFRCRRAVAILITLALPMPCLPADPPAAAAAAAAAPAHLNNYPTFARVQYVEECMSHSQTGVMAGLYQCSCVIDHIAEHLTYDEFVEASTFAHYATLPGEGGGIFRDPDRAKQQAKLYRTLEAQAHKACGIKSGSG